MRLRRVPSTIVNAVLLPGLVFVALSCGDSEPTAPDGLEPSFSHFSGARFAADVDLRPGVPINAATCLSATPTGGLIFDACEFRGTISGDLEGALTQVVRGEQDAGGNGTGGLSSVFIDACRGHKCGTFSGSAEINTVAGLASGSFELRGTSGRFVGSTVRGTFQEQGDPPGDQIISLRGIHRRH